MLEEADLKWNVSEKSKTALNAQILGFLSNTDGFLVFFSVV